MFRFSAPRRIKPYLHAFSPGTRPSEKGMLYRNGYMNAHARVASIQNVQKTRKERATAAMLLLPDQIVTCLLAMITGIVAVTLLWRQLPYQINQPKHRWLSGGMNQHEQYERNDSMSRIFEMHKDAIDNTRSEIERPAVLSAPRDYSSRSGLYA